MDNLTLQFNTDKKECVILKKDRLFKCKDCDTYFICPSNDISIIADHTLGHTIKEFNY